MNPKTDLYENLLKISKEIELLVKLENFDEIEDFLNQREELLKEVSKEDFQIDEIRDLVEQIKFIDERNFQRMENSKQQINKKILGLSKKKNIINCYKQEEIYQPSMVDEINS